MASLHRTDAGFFYLVQLLQSLYHIRRQEVDVKRQT